MPPIYISYRSRDAEVVEQIAQRISLSFGPHMVQINPTHSCPTDLKLDYHIESMMLACETILIVIGPEWSGIDEYGRFRLSSADIPINNELHIALRSEREVILVLIEDADLPQKEHISEEFYGLYDLPVVRLRPESFEADLRQFIPAPDLRAWFMYWFSGRWLKRWTIPESWEG